MNVLEGNKLIAQFMGFTYVEDGDSMYDGQVSICVADLKYHQSWDELMLVIEKIESMGFDFSIYGDGCKTECSILKPTIDDVGQIVYVKLESKIDAVWQTVVKFIENHV